MNIGIVFWRCEYPLIGKHKQVHKQMEEYGPFHQVDGPQGNFLVESVASPVEIDE